MPELSTLPRRSSTWRVISSSRPGSNGAAVRVTRIPPLVTKSVSAPPGEASGGRPCLAPDGRPAGAAAGGWAAGGWAAGMGGSSHRRAGQPDGHEKGGRRYRAVAFWICWESANQAPPNGGATSLGCGSRAWRELSCAGRLAPPPRPSARRSLSGSELGFAAGAELEGLAVHQRGGGQVLHGQSQRLEDGDLPRVGPAGRSAGEELANLRLDVVGPDGAVRQREQVVAGFSADRFAAVGEKCRGGDRLAVQLPGSGQAGSDRVDVRAVADPGALQDRHPRAGRGNDNPGLGHRALGRITGGDRHARLPPP